MKSISSITLALFLMTTGAGLKAQLKSDIGIRFINVNDGLQLEFRKPLNETYNIRFGLSSGRSHSYKHDEQTIMWNDSTQISKGVSSGVNTVFDLRFGVERKLKWNLLSVHADFVLGYQKHGHYSRFDIRTSNNDRTTYWYSNPYPSDPAYAEIDLEYASWHARYVSGGLAVGAALDVPFYRFILGLNLQCVGNMSIPVHHDTYYDPRGDFGSKNAVQFNWYPSAGIALRYVLGSGKSAG